jgi:hypothetical protein
VPDGFLFVGKIGWAFIKAEKQLESDTPVHRGDARSPSTGVSRYFGKAVYPDCLERRFLAKRI